MLTTVCTQNGIESIDITGPDVGVEILVRSDGKVIWVNVDGICRLRICQIPQLEVNDERRPSATLQPM